MAHTALAESSPSQNSRFELPLLADCIAQQPSGRTQILDFGPVQIRLVEILQKARTGKLHVLDLPYDSMIRRDWPSAIDHEPGWPGNGACNLVLSWDYLNYLDTSGLQALNHSLTQVADSDMRLHALIHYAKPDMPTEPGRYFMFEDRQVERRSTTTQQIKAPRHSPKALEKWMPNFKVDRTRLLGNGMQEFLLQFIV